MRAKLRHKHHVLTDTQDRLLVPNGRLVIVIIILASVLPYLNSLQGSFHFDDLSQILSNQRLESFSNLFSPGNLGRRLTHLTFFINAQLHGLDFMLPWHLTNILLHTCCSLVLYWLLHLLIRSRAEEQGNTPFFAAVLFAVHPLATEPVNYIQARAVILYAIFSLLVLCSVIILHRARTWKRRIPSIFMFVASVFLAAISKEVGIFFALTLPVLYVLIFMVPNVQDKKRFGIYSGSAVVIVVGLAIIWLASSGIFSAMINRYDRNFWFHLCGQTTVFWRYVSLALLPLPSRLTVDHDVKSQWLRQYTFLDGDVLFSIVGIVILIVLVGVWCKYKRPQASMFLAIMFVGVLPYFVLTSVEMMVEYRFYLSLTGFCTLVAILLARFAKSHGFFTLTLFALLCILLACCTVSRNRSWRNDVSLWEDAVHKAPRKARTLNALAWALARDEEDPDPVRALKLAKRSFDPRYVDPVLYFNPFMYDTLAETYYVNGMFDMAIKIEQQLIQRGKGDLEFFRSQLDRYKAARHRTESR